MKSLFLCLSLTATTLAFSNILRRAVDPENLTDITTIKPREDPQFPNYCPNFGACGQEPYPACDSDGCEGANSWNNHLGRCTAGPRNHCPCGSVCEPVTFLGPPLCEHGWNQQDGTFGVEQWGKYKGCACASICPDDKDMPHCWDADCQGINQRDFGPGICASGKFAGCKCVSTCLTNDIDCGHQACQGIDSICMVKGPYLGCSCGRQCPWRSPINCLALNCNGLDSGFCTENNSFKDCPCHTGPITK